MTLIRSPHGAPGPARSVRQYALHRAVLVALTGIGMLLSSAAPAVSYSDLTAGHFEPAEESFLTGENAVFDALPESTGDAVAAQPFQWPFPAMGTASYIEQDNGMRMQSDYFEIRANPEHVMDVIEAAWKQRPSPIQRQLHVDPIRWEIVQEHEGTLESVLILSPEVWSAEGMGKVVTLLGHWNRQWRSLPHAMAGADRQRQEATSAIGKRSPPEPVQHQQALAALAGWIPASADRVLGEIVRLPGDQVTCSQRARSAESIPALVTALAAMVRERGAVMVEDTGAANPSPDEMAAELAAEMGVTNIDAIVPKSTRAAWAQMERRHVDIRQGDHAIRIELSKEGTHSALHLVNEGCRSHAQ